MHRLHWTDKKKKKKIRNLKDLKDPWPRRSEIYENRRLCSPKESSNHPPVLLASSRFMYRSDMLFELSVRNNSSTPTIRSLEKYRIDVFERRLLDDRRGRRDEVRRIPGIADRQIAPTFVRECDAFASGDRFRIFNFFLPAEVAGELDSKLLLNARPAGGSRVHIDCPRPRRPFVSSRLVSSRIESNHERAPSRN